MFSCSQTVTCVNEHPLPNTFSLLLHLPQFLPSSSSSAQLYTVKLTIISSSYSTEIYLKHASEDLAVFARHAGRRTIEVEDVILLLRRQRHISESQGFEYLVNTYLPLEYIEELLPCAVAGKRIVPSTKS